MTNANALFNTHAQYSPHFDQSQNQNANPLDTSLAFQNISNLTPSSLDYSQYQTPSFQPRINDGGSRHQSPGFQHPGGYQVNQVIPAKRARPGEEHVPSPQPAPGMLGTSRAQTPQQQQAQQFPNPFASLQHGAQGYSTPNPYQQHMQNGGPQSSPSPALSGQHVLPGQRGPSASPHPFASGSQNYSNYSGPPTNMNRMTANQNQVNQQYMRNMQMNQGFNQRPMGSQPMMQPGIPATMNGPQSGMQNSPGLQFPDAQQQYKMRLQQAQEIATAQSRSQAGNAGQGPGSPVPAQNGSLMGRPGMSHQQSDQQLPPLQQQTGQSMEPNQLNQAQGQAQGLGNKAQEQTFFQRLSSYAQQHGIQLTPNPRICGRPINLYYVFGALTRLGILIPGQNFNNWGRLAQVLGFSEQQFPAAASELRMLVHSDLAGFIRSWYALVQKRRAVAMQQQDPSRPQQMSPQPGNQTIGMPQQGGSLTPAQTYQLQMQLQQQQQAQQAQQAQHTQNQHQQQLQQLQNQQAQLSQVQAQSHQQQPFPPQPTPTQKKARPPSTAQSPALSQQHEPSKPSQSTPTPQDPHPAVSTPFVDNFQVPRKPSAQADQTPPLLADERFNNATPAQALSAKISAASGIGLEMAPVNKEYVPKIRNLEYYGGLQLGQMLLLGEELATIKPSIPTFEEMGVVDIHVLTKSLESGIHGEVRYALDQLVGLSRDSRCLQLSLVDCGDLVDALIECVEDQLAILTDGTSVISDEAELLSYEEVLKAARVENEGLQEEPEFASQEYEMQQAVDRLLAVTTFLRNISFADSALNHDLLAGGPLIPLIATTVNLIGTRDSFLQSARRTLDFYKDSVTLLSNICHRVELPSKDDTLGILRLLVAFAPLPPDSDAPDTDHLTFSPYDPKLHPYLPSAIDALAKLLARDDPNRPYFRSIFASDYTSYLAVLNNNDMPPSLYSLLLTRAFALSIAPLPDRAKTATIPGPVLLRIAEIRKPFLSQGMLAADILATLCPGVDASSSGITSSSSQPFTPLAQRWLESEDGWANSLLYLVIQLGGESQLPNLSQRRDPATGRVQVVEDHSRSGGFGIVAQRGSTTLARLVEKCNLSEVGATAKKSLAPAARVPQLVNGDHSNNDGDTNVADIQESAVEHDEATIESSKDRDRDRDPGFSFGVPFTELVPAPEDLLAALGNPMFDPVVLRSLLTMERLLA